MSGSAVMGLAVRAVRGRLVAAFVIGLAVVATRLVQAFGLAVLAAAPLTGRPWTAGLWGLWLAVGMVVARALLLRFDESFAQVTGHRVTVAVRYKVLEHLLLLGPPYTATRRTGDVAATLVEGAAALETAVARGRTSQVLSWAGPLLAAVAIGVVDPVCGGLIAAALVIAKVAGPLWNKIGRKGHDRVFVDLGAMDAEFIDAVQGMATAKAFGATGRVRERLASQAERVRIASMRVLTALFTQMLVVRWALAGASAAVVVRVGFLSIDGSLSPVATLTVLLIVLVTFVPIDEAGKYLHAMLFAPMAAARLDAFLAEQPLLASPERVLELGAFSTVALEDVSFRYPGREDDAVSGVNLTLRQGRTVALVGPSGSGKSTIVSLLLRLVDPDEGRVSVDGHDLRDVGLERWWQQVAVVSQDTHLFPGSIRDNIALARPDAHLDEVEAAATAAGLSSEIAAMPDGYETQVSERGARLSGGQRQRVAIARALLLDAPVLILDEATAALDGRTEHAVHDAIARYGRDRAVLIVAHRIATVRDADEIVVLDQGRVVERGRHDDLLANAGTYHRLIHAGAAL